jgi:uncharacterized protein YdiU (UPF0061 family)
MRATFLRGSHYMCDSKSYNSRYAFGKQISIMQWNMTRLAATLLPLVDSDEGGTVERLSYY